MASAFQQDVSGIQPERDLVRSADSGIKRVIALDPLEKRQDYSHHLLAYELSHLRFLEQSHGDESRPEAMCLAVPLFSTLDLIKGYKSFLYQLVIELLVCQIADCEGRSAGLEEDCFYCFAARQPKQTARVFMSYLAYQVWKKFFA